MTDAAQPDPDAGVCSPRIDLAASTAPSRPRVAINLSTINTSNSSSSTTSRQPIPMQPAALMDTIEAFREDTGNSKDPHTGTRWLALNIAMALTLMASVQILAVVIWPSCEVGVPCKDRQSQEAYFEEIIADIVPSMTNYAERTADFAGAGSQHFSAELAARDCVTPWLAWLNGTVGITETDPQIIREALRFFRLRNVSWARRAVGDLWDTPVAFAPLLDQVGQCARDNVPLHANLCRLLDEPELAPILGGGPLGTVSAEAQRRAFVFALHVGVVLERFAVRGMQSRKFRVDMASEYARQNDNIEALIERNAEREGVSASVREFRRQKWNSLLMPDSEKRLLEIQGGSSAVSTFFQYQLALNVLEASNVDRNAGIHSNVDLGLMLAVGSLDQLPYFADGGMDAALDYPLSKAYVDAYVAWNINYVSQFGTIFYLPKLLIPSVLCSDDELPLRHWVFGRVLSLKPTMVLLTDMNAFAPAEYFAGYFSINDRSRDVLARTSVLHSDLRPPMQCCGFGSLHSLFETLKPYNPRWMGVTSFLTDDAFQLYYTTIVWLTAVSAGLGSEMVLGATIASALSSSNEGFVLWHLAQLLFSLFLAVAFGAGSVMGLPFLAAGLWKFGFPETTACLMGALHRRSGHPLEALRLWIDGMGTLLHHFSTAFTLVGLMTHLFPYNRAITASCIVPIIQHLFVLLKYHSRMGYVLIELLLEIYFEWEVFAHLNEFKTRHGLWIDRVGRGCAMTMLVAHWFYLAGATLGLVLPSPGQQFDQSKPPSTISEHAIVAKSCFADSPHDDIHVGCADDEICVAATPTPKASSPPARSTLRGSRTKQGSRKRFAQRMSIVALDMRRDSAQADTARSSQDET